MTCADKTVKNGSDQKVSCTSGHEGFMFKRLNASRVIPNESLKYFVRCASSASSAHSAALWM